MATTPAPRIADLIHRFRYGRPTPREARDTVDIHAVGGTTGQAFTGFASSGRSTAAGSEARVTASRDSRQPALARARVGADGWVGPAPQPSSVPSRAPPVAPVPPPHAFNFSGVSRAVGARGGLPTPSATAGRYSPQRAAAVSAVAGPRQRPSQGSPYLGPPIASSTATLPYHSVLGPGWGASWGESGAQGPGHPDSRATNDRDGDQDWPHPSSDSETELEDWEYPGLKETTGELAEQLDFTMMRLAKRCARMWASDVVAWELLVVTAAPRPPPPSWLGWRPCGRVPLRTLVDTPGAAWTIPCPRVGLPGPRRPW
jgi:hypothetical protein